VRMCEGASGCVRMCEGASGCVRMCEGASGCVRGVVLQQPGAAQEEARARRSGPLALQHVKLPRIMFKMIEEASHLLRLAASSQLLVALLHARRRSTGMRCRA
jgi:hypothetical protein